MPEAPPWSPGHVGHTPQHVGEMLHAARLKGIFTSLLPRYRLAYPNRIFPGRLPQLQRAIRNRGPFQTLAGIEDYQRRTQAAGPSRYPLAYQPALRDVRFTRFPDNYDQQTGQPK